MMGEVSRPIRTLTAAMFCLFSVLPVWSMQEPKAFKIVTFGTSLTERGGWQKPLQVAVAACMARPVEVETVARSGATSDWAVTMIDSVASMKPDVVLVEFYANDASVQRLVGLDHSGRNMDTILQAFRRSIPTARVVVMAMNPMHGIRGMTRPFVDDYVERHRQLALKNGYEFLDNRIAWNRLSSGELSEAIPDGVHPRQKAVSAVMVPGLAKTIAGQCKG